MKYLSLIATAISCFASEPTTSFQMIEDKAEVSILNPSLADRKIAKLRLDNGLEAYLISDPGSDQSGAALAVEAGSWHDPKEYPGMAHFCEHMLFMGTKAYPNENEYMHYIFDNGGKVNAFTATDRTVYIFSINNDAFEGALDRFSHFFIDPLFLPSCIGRELHAVDQEHAKNIEHDGWRQYMILKETGNPNHPNVGFSTGNAQTLGGIPQEALKKWYLNNYSSNRMHLVVISPLPLETLISSVQQDFSRVPNYRLEGNLSNEEIFSSEQKGHITYIKPIKDLRRLSLTWELPKEFAKDRERWAAKAVAYALNNESENSLLHELKREKIADNLAVSEDGFSKQDRLFEIQIDLTPYGVSQIQTAIKRCFQAIAQLKIKGVPSYLFEEMRSLATLEYQYQSRDDAFDVLMHHATSLVDENLSTYPEKNSIPSYFDPEFIHQFIEHLTPQNCYFTVLANPSLTGVEVDTKEKWMNAEYTIKEMSKTQLAAWNQLLPHPQIDLPPANPFVPVHLSLVPTNDQATPVLLADDESCKVYYSQDNKYRVPQSAAIFSFRSPLIDGTAKRQVLTDLYLKSLQEKLSSTLSFAHSAGINTSFSQKDLRMEISVDGYSEKVPLLIKNIFYTLKNIHPTQDQFELYRQFLQSNYENLSKELPVFQANELLSSIIYNDSTLSIEKVKAIKGITYEEFMQFNKTVLQKSYTEGLIYGNLSQASAQTLWDETRVILSSSAFPLGPQIRRQVLILPEKNGPYLLIQNTDRQGNGAILLVEEGPFTFEKRAAQQVISKAVQEAFFDTLRTKQQTGYMAKAWDTEVERQLLQFFAVQSSTHHPRDLIARFELFLEDFVKNLAENVPQERFENLRKMAITTLQIPPENLSLMARRLYTLAFDYEGDFSWYQKRIDSLEKLTYDDMAQTAHQFFSRDNHKRLAILVEGVLQSDNDFHYENVSKEDVCEAGTYVSWK